MQDGIIKGTGNSRYLKGAGWPATYEEFKSMAEAGTLPIDLAGINEEGWQQIGMALSKGNLLSDATVEKLDGVETPDAALLLLGRFHGGLGNEYVWHKTKVEDVTHYTASVGSSTGQITLYKDTSINSDYYYLNFQYGTGIAADDNGNVYLTGVYTPAYPPYNSYSTAWQGTIYVRLTNGTVYKIVLSGSNDYGITFDKYLCSSSSYVVQETVSYGYVNSPDINAYPPAESDGYTYTALGQVGNKVQIAIGSYTGTGTYYPTSSNSVILPFVPDAFLIYAIKASDTQYYSTPSFVKITNGMSAFVDGMISLSNGSFALCRNKFTCVDNVVSWACYNDASAQNQLNVSGYTYYYMGIKLN